MNPLKIRVALAAATVTLAAPSTASAIYFHPAQTYQIGSRPDSVAVADVTGDGRRDVLVSTSRIDDGPNDDKLFLFRQEPNGSLASPLIFAAGSDPYVLLERGLGTGDLDGDNDTDVALATWNGVALYHQQDGMLEGPSFVAETTEAREVEVADMNGDASNDLVISAGNRGVLVAKHEGGGFTVVTATPDAQGEIEVGDVTGDGRLDIVGFSTRFVRVYPQLGDGSYGGPIVYEGNVGYWPNGEGLEVADVSGDGRADVLLAIGGNSPGSRLNVFLQNSGGTLNPPAVYPSYDAPRGIEALDMSGDGRADVVTAHAGWLRAGVYVQSSSGTLDPEGLFALPDVDYGQKGISPGDLNGDGLPDIAIANQQGSLVVLRQTPTPSARHPARNPAPPPPTPPPTSPAPTPAATTTATSTTTTASTAASASRHRASARPCPQERRAARTGRTAQVHRLGRQRCDTGCGRRLRRTPRSGRRCDGVRARATRRHLLLQMACATAHPREGQVLHPLGRRVGQPQQGQLREDSHHQVSLSRAARDATGHPRSRQRLRGGSSARRR